jgi:hypothetical protein
MDWKRHSLYTGIVAVKGSELAVGDREGSKYISPNSPFPFFQRP